MMPPLFSVLRQGQRDPTSSTGDRFDLNDVRSMEDLWNWKKGTSSILMALWGMPRVFLYVHCLFCRVLELHVLREF